MARERPATYRDLLGVRALLLIWLPIMLISILHFSTDESLVWFHDVLRRLYYLPIVLGAFAYGLRGSLAAATFATALYAPHAFTHLHHIDPAQGLEKGLEILLYFVFGLVTGFLADREFTERQKQQAAAQQLRRALDDKDEMERLLVRAERLKSLGELTAGLAHEIKNPLASIRGTAESVVEEIKPESPRRRMADILLREIGRLEALLERFLRFAKPQEFDLQDVDVGRVLAEVRELMAPQAKRSGVSIEMAAANGEVRARAGADQLRKALVNVILNAVQAAPGGGVVRLGCDYQNAHHRRLAHLYVEDNGPGIAPELLEKIFDPFVSTKDQSSGLGLSITARLIDQQQGFIEVRNLPTGGARFDVFLPVA
jgi:signal transduction histidine kinase